MEWVRIVLEALSIVVSFVVGFFGAKTHYTSEKYLNKVSTKQKMDTKVDKSVKKKQKKIIKVDKSNKEESKAKESNNDISNSVVINVSGKNSYVETGDVVNGRKETRD